MGCRRMGVKERNGLELPDSVQREGVVLRAVGPIEAVAEARGEGLAGEQTEADRGAV